MSSLHNYISAFDFLSLCLHGWHEQLHSLQLGNLFSRACVIVPTNGSSIVTRLVSRTVTGRELHIHVYQHFDYKLHPVWNHSSSERCVEKMFMIYADVVWFCTELSEGALEGLCTCVSKGFFTVMEDKVEVCFRPTQLPLDWNWSMSESTIKSW